MKRLLHIIAQNPGKTGSGIYLNELIVNAQEKGYKQAVVFGTSALEVNNSSHFSVGIASYPVLFETEELPFPVVGMSDIMPYKSTRYKDLTKEMLNTWKAAFRKQIIIAVENFKPDYIISHHLWILSAQVKELYPNIKVFGICHGTDLRQLDLAPKLKTEAIEGCKKLDLVFALNEYQKEKIEKQYNIEENKIIVAGSGYNSNFFYKCKNRNSTNVTKLVYAGKLSFSKGVVSLINVYSSLKLKNTELILVGSGSGYQAEYIKKLCDKSNNKVILKGTVTQSELGEIFRSSDIFILPSFYEGLPLVLIEAIACNLRVVVTDLPGVKESFGNTLGEGLIEYVKLPKLSKEYVPLTKELPEFEMNLKYAIEKQIENIYCTSENNLSNCILEMSWEKVFNKIEGYLK